ncbi:hypothetical protein [Bythopirellula polymerisocia]|nr:hypothetical protein [Bythopirellula polymerisocia]
MTRTHLLFIQAILAIAIGCAKSEPTQQVTGKISYQAKALDHGMVSFFPAGGRPIGAAITPEGSYEIELPPGQYQVIVNAPPKLPAGFKEGDPLPSHDPNALPAKYSRQQTSGLSATISLQDETQTVDFELE